MKLAILLSLTVLHLTAASPQELLTLRTGRKIPLSALRSRVASATPSDSIRLFEVSRDLKLTGHDRLHDLSKMTAIEQGGFSAPSITVNGKIRPDLLKGAFIRSGNGYTVAHAADGTVVGLWGNGVSLEPLDHAAHRGVFLNARARLSGLQSIELRNDISYKQQKGRLNFGSENARMSAGTKSDVHDGNDMNITDASVTDAHPVQFGKVVDADFYQNVRQAAGCIPSSPKKVIETLVTFDNARCEIHGNNEANAVASVLGAMREANKPYVEQTCLTIRVVNVRAYCNDPNDPFINFKNKDSLDILDDFADYFANNVDTPRDLAIYLPGFDERTKVSGVAWFGGVCSNSVGYGWAEGQEPIVIAHEMGHLLKASHHTNGLMMPRWRPGNPLEFSEFSLTEISNFVTESRQASCLTSGGAPATTVPRTTVPRTTTLPPAPRTTTTVATFPRTTISRQTIPRTTLPRTQLPRTRFPSPRTIVTQPPPPTFPPGSAGTCAAGFDRSNAFRCHKKSGSVPLYSLTRVMSGRTKLTIMQRFGRFRVEMVGEGPVRIMHLSHTMTFTPNLAATDLPPLTTYSRGAKRVRFDWEPTNIQLPFGASTCCGRELTLYIYINHCNTSSNICDSKFFSGPVLVQCNSCAKRSFTPMSRSQKCPRCTS